LLYFLKQFIIDVGAVMDIFIDNGILKNILNKSNPSIAKKFKEDFSRKLVVLTNNSDAHFISSPLMILEYIGIKLPPISSRFPEIKSEIKHLIDGKNFDPNKFGYQLRDLFSKKISSEQISNFDFLLSKLDSEERFRDPYGAELVNILHRPNLVDIKKRYAYLTELSIDEIQGLDFCDIFGDRLHQHLTVLLKTFAYTLADKSLNISFARILHEWYMKLDRDGEASDLARQCKYDFNEKHQDRLDTLLVHYACFGHKRDGQLLSVCCVTTEKSHRIIARCKAYCAHINHFVNTNSLREEMLGPCPGVIFFVNQSTGEVVDEFDLKKLVNTKM
jgi:hypothetical protein